MFTALLAQGALRDGDDQMKESREDGRCVSDLDRSAKKFLANVAQLERMWRQQPASVRAAREMKAVSKHRYTDYRLASIRTDLCTL